MLASIFMITASRHLVGTGLNGKHMLSRFLAAVIVAVTTPGVSAQSSLPECSASQTESYTNCHFVFISETGRQYVIEFNHPTQPGFGTGQSSDGNILQGIWRNREMNGLGSTIRPNGDTFSGVFVNGKRNGIGTFALANGNRFIGEFKDDKRHGPGVEIYVNGNEFVGQFKDDERNGPGTITLANGAMFSGEYKNGRANGHGVEVFANGDKFVGEYRNDRPFGYGTWTFANGDILAGNWSKSLIVGTKIWKDGRKYIGEFDLQGRPNALFSHDVSGPPANFNNNFACGTKDVKRTYFDLLSSDLLNDIKTSADLSGSNAQALFHVWNQIFDGLTLKLLGSPADRSALAGEIMRPFPMLVLDSARMVRQSESERSLECSALLIGNFGPLGTHTTFIQYLVQIADDGSVFVTRLPK